MRSSCGTRLLVGLLTAATVARADLLYFKKGGAVQLPCKREGTSVVIDAPSGPATFAASEFAAILPGGDPAAEWPARFASSRDAGPDRRLASTWWALENGLTPEATRTLRDIHASDPAHEPTATLVRALDAVEPPLPDPDTTALTAALDGSFRTARSPHFLLLHQINDAAAQSRLDVLERVYTSFFLVFAGQGIILEAPRQRLVAVVFASPSDYVAYLRRENAGAFATAQGFYHPARHVVVAFDLDSDPSRLSPTRPDHESPRVALLLDLERRAIGLGVAAHETVHHLVVASRLAPRHDSFPTWLHEGLACQFEVIRGGRWAGVGRSHDLRLPDWRSIRPAPHLAALIRDEGFGRGYRRDLYAEAWSLVYFLRKARPAEFTRFLDLLRAPATEPRDGVQTLELFRTCFGEDVSLLEVEWHRFLRTVTTPLESGPIQKRVPQIGASRD